MIPIFDSPDSSAAHAPLQGAHANDVDNHMQADGRPDGSRILIAYAKSHAGQPVDKNIIAKAQGVENVTAYSAYTEPRYLFTYWVREWLGLTHFFMLGS